MNVAPFHSVAEIAAAVDETERWGTYCTAHLYTDKSIQIAMRAGMKTFEHTHLASEKTYALFADRKIPICAQVAIVSQLKGNPAFVTKIQQKKAAFMAENGSKTFDYAKKYGVKLGFGVDSYGTLEAFRFNSQAISERKNYFSDWQIVQQIYPNNMKLINMCGERLPYRDGALGVIAKVAYADLILVKGNPLKDVTILSDWKNKINFVMKDGEIIRNDLE